MAFFFLFLASMKVVSTKQKLNVKSAQLQPLFSEIFFFNSLFSTAYGDCTGPLPMCALGPLLHQGKAPD